MSLLTPLLLGFCLLLSSCGPTYYRHGDRPGYSREEGAQAWATLVVASPVNIQRLKDTADTYLGMPYLWGGNGPDSIDCSAFTQQVLRRAYGLELPRRALWQSEMGYGVFKYALLPGDLVFFGPQVDSVDHVGIYMGNNLFINATSSQGVRYSSLDEPFWQQKYLFARRLYYPTP